MPNREYQDSFLRPNQSYVPKNPGEYYSSIVCSTPGIAPDITRSTPSAVGTVSGATAPGIVTVGAAGSAIDWAADATNRGHRLIWPSQPPTTFTYEAYVEFPSSLPATNEPIMGFQGGGSWDRTLQINTTGAVQFYGYWSGAGAQNIISASTYSPRTLHHIAVSVAPGAVRLVIDGVSQGTSTSGAFFTGYTGPSLNIGYAQNTGGIAVKPTHKLYYANILRRNLSLAEIAERAQAPFTFLGTTKRRQYYFLSGTSIIPSLASWGWNGGAPNLNSKTSVIGGNATWSWSGGVPVVNVKTIIAAAQATWAWFGNRVTSFPGSGSGGGGGMVQGLVRGLVRVIVRGTNVGKP